MGVGVMGVNLRTNCSEISMFVPVGVMGVGVMGVGVMGHQCL